MAFLAFRAARTVLASGEHQSACSELWHAGTAIEAHAHEGEASLHVLAGELVEERWTPTEDGAYRYAQRTLRAGDEAQLPPGAFHRIAVRRPSSVLVASAAPCVACVRAEASLEALVRLSRSEAVHDGEPHTTTVGWRAPAPEDVSDHDA